MKHITDPSPHEPGDAVTDGRDGRWADHREQRRAELIKAARTSIHREGPGVPMDRIAAAAGTSKSVFYRYFGGKDGLRSAIGDDVMLRLRRAVLRAGREASGPVDTLRAMISAYLSQAAASPNTYAFVLGVGEAGSRAQVDALTEDLVVLLSEQLEALLAQRRGPAPLDLVALWPSAALGLIRSAGDRWLATEGERRPPQEIAETITQWLLIGVAPSDRADAAASTPTDLPLNSLSA